METQKIYSLRNSFSIIGLVGKTGSGCTLFSRIISREFAAQDSKMLRKPSEIEYLDDLSDNNTIFKRKYTICYDYFKKESHPYKTISYISVLFFYIIHYSIFKKNVKTEVQLINALKQLMDENFKKSKDKRDDNYKDSKISKKRLSQLCGNYELLISLFSKLESDFESIKDTKDLKNLYDCYYSETFTSFTDNFYKLIAGTDYYLGALFVHRIGNKIRATGNPFDTTDLKENASPEYIYTIVYVINKLIKAWKTQNEKCHICIDSLRNSLEIMFLKERYSGFYMIAIHNEGRHEERIKERIIAINKLEKVKIVNSIDTMVKKLINLDEIERFTSDFKKGHFFAPDVDNCIQKSEIHINNPGKDFSLENNRQRDICFYTMIEQWIRIKALISHPGIVTPTQEERCMQIAYSSKFNSGCISRQVGAVITDQYNSIRSVGWNDVPKGQVPCNLRNINEIINPVDIDTEHDKSYSEFELNQEDITYNDGGNFSHKTKEIFKENVKVINEAGLNHSFCFKSLHNKYEIKDNQVHTRSLHAEENAMLQISKFGGQPLMSGTLYTTASPCELCSKKAYQLGIKKIIYIDPYPGISSKHILGSGFNKPELKMFTGIIGKSYIKLFEPFLSYKDELTLMTKNVKREEENKELNVKDYLEKLINKNPPSNISLDEIKNKLMELTD